MSNAILRGFDFLAADIDEELRFCNPLLSFGTDEVAPIYVARDLDWDHLNDGSKLSLTLVDQDEIDSFATLITGSTISISPSEGVVLLGHRFSTAAQTAGIDMDANSLVKLTASVNAPYRIGIATVATYRQFTSQIIREATSVFDKELQATVVTELPPAADAALFLLRKCGLIRPTDLAIRHLVAAHITRQLDMYRRLLIKYSLELKATEYDLHRRVERHIGILRGERVWYSTSYEWTQFQSPDWFGLDLTKKGNRLKPLIDSDDLTLGLSSSNRIVLERGNVTPVYSTGSSARIMISKRYTEDQTRITCLATDWPHDTRASVTIQASVGTVEKFPQNLRTSVDSVLAKTTEPRNELKWAETSLRHH